MYSRKFKNTGITIHVYSAFKLKNLIKYDFVTSNYICINKLDRLIYSTFFFLFIEIMYQYQ